MLCISGSNVYLQFTEGTIFIELLLLLHRLGYVYMLLCIYNNILILFL